MINDNATIEFPEFKKMTLDQARQAFCDWVDTTWDFHASMESHKFDARQSTSVKQIHKHAINALASGLVYKARGL